MNGTYKSEALAALHETVSGLHKIGLMSGADMRFYNEGCLAKAAPTPRISTHTSSSITARSAVAAYAQGS